MEERCSNCEYVREIDRTDPRIVIQDNLMCCLLFELYPTPLNSKPLPKVDLVKPNDMCECYSEKKRKNSKSFMPRK